MKTLLRIDSSARHDGSHSRDLADHFQSRWLARHPQGKIITRDLGAEPPPHLNGATIADFFGGNVSATSQESNLALSEVLIAELFAADDLVISSSLYNFTVSSPLKAYLDHIVRMGRTVQADQNGFHGMLASKSACILTARGGGGLDDFHGPYLQKVLQFLGIECQEWISLDGSVNGDGKLEERIIQAKLQIERWLELAQTPLPADEIEWQGAFSLRDREEISALRQAQTAAIVTGDAKAYAALCEEDIVLLLQGSDLIQGQRAFYECEREMLAKTQFTEMRQLPIRIERHGQMAIEVGRQEITTVTGETDSYKARRKYSHVLRNTASGWRFAVLMSNNSL